MKKILIFGASGKTGKYVLEELERRDGMSIAAFSRSPQKMNDWNLKSTEIIQGDALDAADVARAMQDCDVVVASLDGDVLPMARNIVAALDTTQVKRIIWMTGMGIHGEITGARGLMLKTFALTMPDYIKAADCVFDSKAITTLLRCPRIVDGDTRDYDLTPEGVQPLNLPVDRAAIACCVADLIDDDTRTESESLGLTNKGV